MEEQIFKVTEDYKSKTLLDNQAYLKLYQQSVEDPEKFWAEQANIIDWFQKWKQVKDVDYHKAQIQWYIGGKTNVCYNCLDRHLETDKKHQTALIWEGDDPSVSKSFTYAELHEEVCKCANILKNCGITAGDRVVLYMPMIPELAIACLACTRIGAVHSVVFGGFSAEALRSRILDCTPKLVITADGGVRGNKEFPLKANCDHALKDINVEHCLVVKRTGQAVQMQETRDLWWHLEAKKVSADCPVVELDAEAPLFILYTSGSTGAPKGVLHTTGGYLVYASLTFKYVFDYQAGDVYWCTADIGWITGHSYILYGPLSNGATTLMFEGVPQYPDFGRFWDVIDKHQVNIFYTAPTAIRAINREGDELVKKRDLSSLKVLGTVGEPINPEAWLWYHRMIGKGNCPIVDTWWQTETGGIMITPLPGATDTKPGSSTRPFFGIQPAILNKEGQEQTGEANGMLCIKEPWPGQMRTLFGDHKRFYQTYFSQFAGYYFTGDGCRRDKDGYYWITGRVDDVINVSGHRLGTAEIESAIVSHPHVAEAAVVGVQHKIKGQAVYAFVSLKAGVEPADGLKAEVLATVSKEIGKFARPDVVHWTADLPKTRSGKIMRRILRKIANQEEKSIGDVSTLADPSVVQNLIETRHTLAE